MFLRPIQNKGRLPLEIGLTFSFTLPPVPPSVSDLKMEKVKAQLGLHLENFKKKLSILANYFQFLFYS